jgi:hypothetical protein
MYDGVMLSHLLVLVAGPQTSPTQPKMSEATAIGIGHTFLKIFGPDYPGKFRDSSYVAAFQKGGVSTWTLQWIHSSGVLYNVMIIEGRGEVMSARASRLYVGQPAETTASGKPAIASATAARKRITEILKVLAPALRLKIRELTYGSVKSKNGKPAAGAVVARVDMIERGYPVMGFGCAITLNSQNGLLVSYAGRLIPPRFPKVTPKPMSFDQALAKLRVAERMPRLTLAKSDVNPLGWLVPKGKTEARLAWRLMNGPSSKRTLEFCVDATTGEVLSTFLAK